MIIRTKYKISPLLNFAVPGIVIILLVVVIKFAIVPVTLRIIVSLNLRLIPGATAWGIWSNPPIPIYLTFYIYHVTNPDEVENGEKPVFEEKGPYAYRQTRLKVNCKHENGKNTLKYREKRTYFFDQEASGNNSEGDLVNIPNIPFVSIMHETNKVAPFNFIIPMMGNILFANETLIKRNISVGDFLFYGYDVKKYTQSIFSRKLPKEFRGGKFGVFKGKNDTPSELWEVYTGYDDSSNFGRIISWNKSKELHYWKNGSDCDLPKGTDGSIFAPFLTKETMLHVFSPEICRSISLTYNSKTSVRGIPGYRYTAPKWNFDNPRVNEDNACYCLAEDLEDCSFSGILPLDSCEKGPMWTSPAHFLDSDDSFIKQFGLPPPVREKHQAYLDLEPITGLLIRAHKRLQFGLELRGHENVTSFKYLPPRTFFPVMWVDENAEIDEAFTNFLKNIMFIPLQIVNICLGILLGLGIVLFAIGTMAFIITVFKDVLHGDVKNFDG